MATLRYKSKLESCHPCGAATVTQGAMDGCAPVKTGASILRRPFDSERSRLCTPVFQSWSVYMASAV